MIRGMLEKGSSRAKTSDEKTPASASSTSTESADSSVSSGRKGRPTTSSEDATASGGFRDSTVPIAKSISQSAGKLFRSIDRSVSTDSGASSNNSSTSHQQHHHPLHSSRLQNPGMSSSVSNLTNAVDASKANKKCTMCVKSFNPLRRRYYCRTCPAQVCSHCSISRKVDSLEGSISIRICMACKLSAISSADDDHYERVFSVSSGIHPGDDGGMFSIDRASSMSYMSSKGPLDKRSQNLSSTSSTASTPDHFSRQAQTPASAPGGLRRTSSSASTKSAARSRRDSFGSTATSIAALTDCQMCMNEVCGPLVDLTEVTYPAMEVKVEAGSTKFIRARGLDNERERLVSMRKIRKVLTTSPQVAQRFTQLCSMASIATQCPIAVVGLLDREDYFVVAETGLPNPTDPISRNHSLASHTCRNGAPLVCNDLSADARFAGNPWRRDSLHALFYAGIPLTLANGHTIGVIEVFDKTVRFACVDVITQLQAVVRGLLKKFEEILASVVVEKVAEPETVQEDPIALAIAELERSTSYTEVKPSVAPPRSPVRRAPAPAAPPAAPFTASSGTDTPAAAAAEAAPVTPSPVTPEDPAAPTPATGPTENEMEMQLMKLLSQTTNTQEQLRTQQTHMVHAISSHSKQISEMAKQLARMENTLASKLDGPVAAAKADTPEVEAVAAP